MGRLSLTILLLFPLLAGCQLDLFGRRRPVSRAPVLSADSDATRVAGYLNSGTDKLRSWRCGETKVYLRMPGLPMPQRLSGSLACESPGRFRLVAGNVVGVHADLGANEDGGWVYAKPGESVVLTWRHEDAWMLGELMPGFPQLDPQWLMQLLGLSPLNAGEYVTETPAEVTGEIWLVREHAGGDGVQRWVVKVDRQEGRIREQVLYGPEGDVLVRAELSDYQGDWGFRLAHHMRLVFPETSTELTLTLGRIETNPVLSENLWRPPANGSVRLVDLRELEKWSRENGVRRGLADGGAGSDGADREMSETELPLGAVTPVGDSGSGTAVGRTAAVETEYSGEPDFDVPARKRSRWLWWVGRE